ncbi:MAG: hypothetical protein KGS72_02100 [Cyanobacteria bacterium REEB67]|nr:hypothetical protein [Cyanobacteria bacterium REEB67]
MSDQSLAFLLTVLQADCQFKVCLPGGQQWYLYKSPEPAGNQIADRVAAD